MGSPTEDPVLKEKVTFLEAQVPKLLKLAGFGEDQRRVLVKEVVWMLGKTTENDERLRRVDLRTARLEGLLESFLEELRGLRAAGPKVRGK